jgi:hypothetical protein
MNLKIKKHTANPNPPIRAKMKTRVPVNPTWHIPVS